jgi:hypothetical protein
LKPELFTYVNIDRMGQHVESLVIIIFFNDLAPPYAIYGSNASGKCSGRYFAPHQS